MIRPAALLLSVAFSALAMGAAAQDMPELSAERIAADVQDRFDPRTGAAERVAPTFDPFEDAPDLAAEVSLRSVAAPVRDLDGRTLADGALLDITLFLSRGGDFDPVRTRDALFLNGQPVPIVRRDSREVECSSRVTETVYLSDRYYGGYRGYGGLTRSRPGYVGFGGFGRGPGYHDGRFGGGHGYGGHFGGQYGGYAPRRRPRTRPPVPVQPVRRPEPQTPATRVYDPNTLRRSDDSGQGRPRRGQDGVSRRDYERGGRPIKPRRNPSHPATAGGNPSRPAVVSRPRNVPPSVERQPAPRPAAPAPRPAPKPKPKAAPRTRPSKPRQTTTARTPVHNGNRRKMDLFPQDYAGRDSVVVASSRDCAVEDVLTLFIPAERLDAARFDGLTVIVRDIADGGRPGETRVYDERALYVPPNYIEGFRLATARR